LHFLHLGVFCTIKYLLTYLSCICDTLDETTRNVQLIREELTEVKNLLGSLRQPSECNAGDSTSTLCERKIHLPSYFQIVFVQRQIDRSCVWGL